MSYSKGDKRPRRFQHKSSGVPGSHEAPEVSFESGDAVNVEDLNLDQLDLETFDIGKVVDNLSERRTETRILGLRQLAAFLRSTFSPDSLEGQTETLEMYLMNILKRGQASEMPHLADVIGLSIFTLTEEGEQFIKAFFELLVKYVGNWSNSDEGRIPALRALGAVCFVAGSVEHTEQVMDLCQSIYSQAHGQKKGIVVSMKDRNPELVSTALEVWGVLATTIDEDLQAGHLCSVHLPLFLELLDHPDSQVRAETGENIAFLHEAFQLSANPVYKEEDIVQHKPNFKLITEKLEEVGSGLERSVGKKERREQRKSFREFLKSVQDNEAPTETVSVLRQKFEIEGWVSIKHLNFIRSVLTGGFLVHLKDNDLVQAILDIDLGPPMSEYHQRRAHHARLADARDRAKETFLSRQKKRKKKQKLIRGAAEEEE